MAAFADELFEQRGNTDTELDTATLRHIQDINKLPPKDKGFFFEFLDSLSPTEKSKTSCNHKADLGAAL